MTNIPNFNDSSVGGTENYVDPLFSNMQTYCTLREAAIFEPCVQHLKNLSNKMGAILFGHEIDRYSFK